MAIIVAISRQKMEVWAESIRNNLFPDIEPLCSVQCCDVCKQSFAQPEISTSFGNTDACGCSG